MRRPWNIVDVPVYSLATYKDGLVNMNICTYVTPISMKPKQYAVAVYYGTETFDRISREQGAILQILAHEHIPLVRTLGKKSGHNIDKHQYLEKRNLLMNWKGNQVLTGSCALIQLKKLQRTNTKGDHELFLFEALNARTYSEDNILMFQDLIEQKVIL